MKKKEIKKKIENDLPKGLEIRILNPCGLIIMGYSKKGWNDEEKQAIEILRRQYSHISDIITYNDLIERLENTISRFEIERSFNTSSLETSHESKSSLL